MRLVSIFWWQPFMFLILAVGASTSIAALNGPKTLDGCFFGPVGGLWLYLLVAASQLGPLALGFLSLVPSVETKNSPYVPSVAPLHVWGLLGAGSLDLSNDTSLATSPALSFAALMLGGLWSRRLGPHKEVWSWDVVEITAVDLLASELASEHFWQGQQAQAGVAWGGGEVRMFRAGLAASHHHLSITGLEFPASNLWRQGIVCSAFWTSLWLVYWPHSRALGQPARVKPSLPSLRKGAAPIAFGEASLAAWVAAVLAPSGAVVSAWGFWGAPLYLWLLASPFFFYSGLIFRPANKTLWAHSPLLPLAHIFAAPQPWYPSFFVTKLRPLAQNGQSIDLL